MNQREKTKRSPHGVRFALSGGYSHRLGKLASGLKSSYKTGFVIGGDLAGFFNEYIGLGGFVNYRQYNDGSVSSVVARAQNTLPVLQPNAEQRLYSSMWIWVTYPTRRACHP